MTIPLSARLEADRGHASAGSDNRLGAVTLGGRGRHDFRLRIGDQCDLEGFWAVHSPTAEIAIGSRSEVNAGCVLDVLDQLTIGDDVLIAADVYIADHDSHSLDWTVRAPDHLARRRGQKNWDVVPHAPVRIEDKAWIARSAMVLKGVTVGEGAVVAAGSVVTRPVDPWTLVAGAPASEVRKLPRPEQAAS